MRFRYTYRLFGLLAYAQGGNLSSWGLEGAGADEQVKLSVKCGQSTSCVVSLNVFITAVTGFSKAASYLVAESSRSSVALTPFLPQHGIGVTENISLSSITTLI